VLAALIALALRADRRARESALDARWQQFERAFRRSVVESSTEGEV
jgi:hypothetical protein